MKFVVALTIAGGIQSALGQTLASLGAQRPSLDKLKPWPKTLDWVRGPWHSPIRNPLKICIVPPSTKDSSPAILQAAKRCNNGGTVVFLPFTSYYIASPLDLTFLNAIDFAILGKIILKDDIAYWQTHGWIYQFQNAFLFWRFGGTDVNIYGLGIGTIDGLGNSWWKAWKLDPTVKRPHLFGTDGLKDATMSGLKMVNPPNWFNFLSNSSNILITDMKLDVQTLNTSFPAKNTDGWDTYRSKNIIIQNSEINNTDDCVSFKPNSTQILVQNLKCNGSHGISVGSLGQYVGEYDIAEDIYVYNISISNATDGARIKIWPGAVPGGTGDAGGGSGHARNITYDTYNVQNVDSAISLTQCYSAKSQALCNQYPASLVISDVVFKNFKGVTSKKNDPKTGYIVCSSPGVCQNIQAHNIKMVPPSGKPATFQCVNVNNSLLDVPCTA